MKVINRSDANVTYNLPERNIRRLFAPWEEKDITPEELEALYSLDGGADIIKQYLMITDRDWVDQHFDAPLEYFWGEEEIKQCLFEDSLELFSETLDFAPDGVMDLLKYFAWSTPLSDLNKMEIFKEKTGFDVLASINIMKQPETDNKGPSPSARRRREA